MKKLTFFALAALLVFASAFSCFANGIVTDKSEEINGITYYDYTITGQSSGKTADVHCIEFTPQSGYVPMAYVANAGSVDLLANHISHAEANGYTVVGAINGSFFEMATGNPLGTLISDGKLVFTHATVSEEVGVFGYDGSFTIATSRIQFKFRLAGKNVPAGIGLVNKPYSACKSFNLSVGNRFHYYDIDACDLADQSVAGYEFICEKLNGTELSVGRNLSAKILEIKENSYYGATKITDENKFVLFVAADSQKFLPRAKELKVGDDVSIYAEEGQSLATDIMNNAQSAISSSYWLVQDGVDKTQVLQTIVHSTTLARAWTAFGIKEDGTYVFWASSEVDGDGNNAVTLQDVAAAMISMGCKNVIRLDGGGSTGIYIKDKGQPITTTRKVCDALLIVKADNLKAQTPVEEPDNGSNNQSKPEESKPEESVPEESKPEESKPEESVPEESVPEEGNNNGEKSSNLGMLIGIGSVVSLIVAVVIVFVIKKKKQ